MAIRTTFTARHSGFVNMAVAGVIGVLAASLTGWLDGKAHAQYFGRNKVRYEQFDFRRLPTESFDIHFYPSEEVWARTVARLAERWESRLGAMLDHTPQDRYPLILYADRADFRQTNVLPGTISLGTRAVTEGFKNRVVLPLSGILGETDRVLGHELVHAFQFDILKSEEDLSFAAVGRLPLWFVEGMAEFYSHGQSHPLTTMWLRDALLRDALPSIQPASFGEYYSPYRHGHAVWSFIAREWGSQAVQRCFREAARSDWRKAIRHVLGLSPDSLSRRWHAHVRKELGPALGGRTAPDSLGRSLLLEGGEFELSPVLSPAGDRVAFLAQRDLFTIDMYVADTHTGKVLTRVASSARNEHLDALRFADSAGAWSPDGRQLAFVVARQGDFAIEIRDMETGAHRDVALDSIPGITHVAWSPDGRRLAFFANAGGMGDLFLYNLEEGRVQRRTSDRYCELQPTWSPDGSRIAFMTERGEDTHLDRLEAGSMKIGLLDLASDSLRVIRLPGATHHLSPQFTPDGRSLLFVANPDGFNDLFRYDLEDAQAYRITRIATGITGLTELSPTLSVAADSGSVALTTFHAGSRQMRLLRGDELEGQLYPQVRADDTADETAVDRRLKDAVSGLPSGEDDYAIEPYDASLELLRIGQVRVGVVADRYSTYLGGGVHMLWGDMLGNRRLAVDAQVNGGIEDIGAQVTYQLLKHRTNLSFMAAHIPFRSMAVRYGRDSTTVGDERVEAWRTGLLRERIFLERAALLSEYPLSRYRRIEAGLGYSHLSYDREWQEILVYEGSVVDSWIHSGDAPSPLDLVSLNLAYVGDYSFAAFTGPIRGHRYRLEVEPTFGSLRYLHVAADYRHYLDSYPVILAGRLLHQGRYLEDAESDRLSAFYLGYPTLVRGYDLASIEPWEASHDPDDEEAGPVDRLLGSRVGILNLEVRVPLLGNSRYGLVNMPYLPTTVVAFLDGGVAWTQTDPPAWRLSDSVRGRVPVFSSGAAVRFNLFGALVAQVYYARPFQRPETKGQFGFVIAPGW